PTPTPSFSIARSPETARPTLRAGAATRAAEPLTPPNHHLTLATNRRRRCRVRSRLCARYDRHWVTSSRRRARPVRRRSTITLRRTGHPLPCRSIQPRRPTRSIASPGFQSNPPYDMAKFLPPPWLLPGPPPA
uniref:Uncharacterized protein n=1 Tax=Triticum urartu TaxID=4572 RepID=A0A8R7PTH3_TRIUA